MLPKLKTTTNNIIKIMDYKKSKAPTNTVTHNLMDFCKGTDNIY